jgi:DNA-binding response OmpR family regulator
MTETPAVLTLREYKLYDALKAQLNRWVLYDELALMLTGYDDIPARATLRTHMSRLRRKLPEGAIESSWGIGYRLTREAPVDHAVYR